MVVSPTVPIIIKKCKCPEPEHHSSAWKIAFADLLTALMSFFLIMWLLEVMTPEQKDAIAKYFSDQTVIEASGANDSVIDGGGTSAGLIDLGGGLNTSEHYRKEMPADKESEGEIKEVGSEGSEASSEALAMVFDQIAASLKEINMEDSVDISLEDSLVRLTIGSDILYGSGQTSLSKKAKVIIDQISGVLLNDFHPIRVEGHTDSLAVVGDGAIRSNWEFSSLRAAKVVSRMSLAGIAGDRIKSVGMGEHRPVASNVTESGRARNRRVEVIIGGIYAK